jgi:hypothetical protein
MTAEEIATTVYKIHAPFTGGGQVFKALRHAAMLGGAESTEEPAETVEQHKPDPTIYGRWFRKRK